MENKDLPIKKVLVIGSGPIVIGQAAEFDYAGTQACRALREEGVTTVLANSNPATIMTDEDIADVVYIEPLSIDVLERIISREKPDGLLATLGGQTGLNLAVELASSGILKKYGVRLLGTPLDAIKNAEDRDLFRQLLININEPVPPSATVNSLEEAKKCLDDLSLPLVIRPAYTLGGTGGGIANTLDEFYSIVRSGIESSPINQVLLERSLVGWKELEYEVMRDSADNCITICNMENIDPMGVHTGDSIVVAPSQTLSDKDHQLLRSASLKIIRSLGIEGGCNVQFAMAPSTIVGNTLPGGGGKPGEYYVIEVNPRVSRSSALASKATGYPIARVAAKIAVGNKLADIANAVTQKTSAAFEPALDYCVVKIPRWPFDKFSAGDRSVGTQMKATGEVMAIDRSFESAFQKAVRSLEISNRSINWEDPSWKSIPGDKELLSSLYPNDQRLWSILFSLRNGVPPEKISELTGVDPWFVWSFKNIADMEDRLTYEDMSPLLMLEAKRLGLSDETIGFITTKSPSSIRQLRMDWNIKPVYKMVDTCAAEFEAETPYFYSTYEDENEAAPIQGNKAVVIGSGPIRIGQGIEFDYCSVHSSWALQKSGFKSILVNSNPETVSTDFDTSDRLYFEPLDYESLRNIIDNENLDHVNEPSKMPPSLVQFGGQTAINLSQQFASSGMPILGSTSKSINTASDRHLFEEFLSRVNIPNPPGEAVTNLDDALVVAEKIGYPVLVRPSYVLGGRAMEIVQSPSELKHFIGNALEAAQGKNVLIDKYFEGLEVEVDAICDGESVLIPGIMEHIERAGVHSGDSMAIYPELTLTRAEVETIVDYTTRIGLELGVRGLMNIQYVVVGGPANRSLIEEENNPTYKTEIYVIEVNPRSSRTIPFISKVTGVPMVKLAINAILGKSLAEQGFKGGLWPRQNLVAVKAPVFSMSKLSGVDTYLGPEMKSTGEVMGIDHEFRPALAKALIASGLMLPQKGSILLSISDKHKEDSKEMIRSLHNIDYKLFATKGTAAMICALGIPVTVIPKIEEDTHPNVIDIIMNGTVDAVINTVTGDRKALLDGFQIRRHATEFRIPCFTWLDTARAAIEGLALGSDSFNIKPIHNYRNDSP